MINAHRAIALSIAVITMGLLLASCGGDGGSGPDDTTPAGIDELNIQDGATDLSLGSRPEVTFDSPMDGSTITESTLYLEERALDAHVEYDEESRTATLTPDTLLAPNTPHRLVISDDIEEENGTPLPETVTIDFETGDFDCDGISDYMEPNGEVPTAPMIEFDRWYRTLTLCEDDRDYFRFTLTETAKVWINAVARHLPGTQWSVTFRTEEGLNYVMSIANPALTDTTRRRFTFLPGTYGVGVTVSSAPMYFLYDFMINTDEPCDDDAWEDNDFLHEAQPVTPGTIENLRSCYADSDWFSLSLEEGQTITVTMDVESPGAATMWSLAVLDEDELVVESELGSDDPMVVTGEVPADGTYYVAAWYSGEGAHYSLDISIDD